jgi:CO dehydrogenase/acetyl-CoA synthase alpha subunit
MQADNEIEEEHLLNFVVNSLDDELPIDLSENVEVTTEELYEVLTGAGAGENRRSVQGILDYGRLVSSPPVK